MKQEAKVINILKNGTEIEDMSSVYVPAETVQRIADICAQKEIKTDYTVGREQQ